MIDFEKILRTLAEADVRFVLVGALSAAMQGVQISTFDVDVVHERSPDNLRRLESALAALGARYRGHEAIRPDAERLDTDGHHLLITDCGPLDVLGKIEEGLDYQALVVGACTLSLGDFAVQALPLAEYARLRRKHMRPRDRARLPLIDAALREEE